MAWTQLGDKKVALEERIELAAELSREATDSQISWLLGWFLAAPDKKSYVLQDGGWALLLDLLQRVNSDYPIRPCTHTIISLMSSRLADSGCPFIADTINALRRLSFRASIEQISLLINTIHNWDDKLVEAYLVLIIDMLDQTSNPRRVFSFIVDKLLIHLGRWYENDRFKALTQRCCDFLFHPHHIAGWVNLAVTSAAAEQGPAKKKSKKNTGKAQVEDHGLKVYLYSVFKKMEESECCLRLLPYMLSMFANAHSKIDKRQEDDDDEKKRAATKAAISPEFGFFLLAARVAKDDWACMNLLWKEVLEAGAYRIREDPDGIQANALENYCKSMLSLTTSEGTEWDGLKTILDLDVSQIDNQIDCVWSKLASGGKGFAAALLIVYARLGDLPSLWDKLLEHIDDSYDDEIFFAGVREAASIAAGPQIEAVWRATLTSLQNKNCKALAKVFGHFISAIRLTEQFHGKCRQLFEETVEHLEIFEAEVALQLSQMGRRLDGWTLPPGLGEDEMHSQVEDLLKKLVKSLKGSDASLLHTSASLSFLRSLFVANPEHFESAGGRPLKIAKAIFEALEQHEEVWKLVAPNLELLTPFAAAAGKLDLLAKHILPSASSFYASSSRAHPSHELWSNPTALLSINGLPLIPRATELLASKKTRGVLRLLGLAPWQYFRVDRSQALVDALRGILAEDGALKVLAAVSKSDVNLTEIRDELVNVLREVADESRPELEHAATVLSATDVSAKDLQKVWKQLTGEKRFRPTSAKAVWAFLPWLSAAKPTVRLTFPIEVNVAEIVQDRDLAAAVMDVLALYIFNDKAQEAVIMDGDDWFGSFLTLMRPFMESPPVSLDRLLHALTRVGSAELTPLLMARMNQVYSKLTKNGELQRLAALEVHGGLIETLNSSWLALAKQKFTVFNQLIEDLAKPDNIHLHALCAILKTRDVSLTAKGVQVLVELVHQCLACQGDALFMTYVVNITKSLFVCIKSGGERMQENVLKSRGLVEDLLLSVVDQALSTVSKLPAGNSEWPIILTECFYALQNVISGGVVGHAQFLKNATMLVSCIKSFQTCVYWHIGGEQVCNAAHQLESLWRLFTSGGVLMRAKTAAGPQSKVANITRHQIPRLVAEFLQAKRRFPGAQLMSERKGWSTAKSTEWKVAERKRWTDVTTTLMHGSHALFEGLHGHEKVKQQLYVNLDDNCRKMFKELYQDFDAHYRFKGAA